MITKIKDLFKDYKYPEKPKNYDASENSKWFLAYTKMYTKRITLVTKIYWWMLILFYYNLLNNLIFNVIWEYTTENEINYSQLKYVQLSNIFRDIPIILLGTGLMFWLYRQKSVVSKMLEKLQNNGTDRFNGAGEEYIFYFLSSSFHQFTTILQNPKYIDYSRNKLNGVMMDYILFENPNYKSNNLQQFYNKDKNPLDFCMLEVEYFWNAYDIWMDIFFPYNEREFDNPSNTIYNEI